MDVARLVPFAAEAEEKAIAADAKNFWHTGEFYSRDTSTDKDFDGPRTAATICGHSRRHRIAGDTPAATDLLFFVAEEAAVADELGNLRRDRLIPAFVATGDALQDVS
jgi:hypothetical protein